MKTILIVEDDRDVSSNIQYMLSKSGYTVLVAHDGDSGFLMAKEKKPDVIIMDVMLPGIPGGDVVSLLQKQPSCRDIPVVFLTGLMSNREVSEGTRMINIDGKVYPALAKPFNFSDLVKTIENLTKTR